MRKFEDSIVQKLKVLPAPIAAKPAHCQLVARETVKDADVSKKPFELLLTKPTPWVDQAAVAALFSRSFEKDEAQREQATASAIMYLQTCDMALLAQTKAVDIQVDGVKVSMKQGEHFTVRA